MPDGLHERDFYTWAMEQARLLRAKGDTLPDDPVDWINVADEIEWMGNEVPRRIRSAHARIIERLLKLEHSPAAAPRDGWKQSVIVDRGLIMDEVDDNPGVRPHLDALFAKAWPSARRLAAGSLADHDRLDPSALPVTCPYTRAQVESFDWWPVTTPADR